ncbi:MAG: amylo-alpha-1,6-glucosidase [Acidimicrobiales bacterium]
MSNPWTFAGEPATSLQGGSVTLVEGTSFSIASPGGDIEPGAIDGLFFEDTRFVSTWRIRLDEEMPQVLAVIPRHPFAATFVARGRPNPGDADSTLLLQRTRYVGNGMREDLAVHNLSQETAACTITFELDADFANVFEVKEARVRERGHRSVEVKRSTMSFVYQLHGASRGLSVRFPVEARVVPGLATMDVVVPPGGEWRASLAFRLSVDDEMVELRYRGEDPEKHSVPARRLRAWEKQAPRVRCADKALETTFLQSERDLGALRIFDPEHPDRSVIAAGAPWFMTLFGRDSLITSLMTLDVDPSTAAGTLRTLARTQGVRVDGLTEEEPGKILHEMRRGLTSASNTRAGSIYYGSIDSTPLFVLTLGALHRWGAPEGIIDELLPHADRALEWIERYGDRDGDGFVEYQRATERGLLNQGWKDSFDAISFASGRLGESPIALCEVQGYVYAAYLARADIAAELGDASVAREWRDRAEELKRAFNDRFWLDERGYFALGLDGEKRPIDSLTSNIGHCLWSGIADTDKAERVAEHLCGPEMFNGWGIRTLATSMKRYNPVSYHNGSVWPHDSAICAAGLARYGFFDRAQRITVGLLEAASAFGGRLPELFCGFDRDAFPTPVPYPSSCSPQAWASATPFLLLRTTLLGLDPSIPDGTLTCSPHVPAAYGDLSVENLYLAQGRISIEAAGEVGKVSGLPEGIELVADRRVGGSALPASHN